MSNVRLFVEHPLAEGEAVPLSQAQANYLFAVMRLAVGATLHIFDGINGEFLAEVVEANKRRGVLVCRGQTRALLMPPDLWLLFAPIKKVRTDFIVEKATELGAARILPVTTEFTNAERVRQDKLQAHAIEAAEQCGGTFVPPVDEVARLDRVLADWPAERHLIFADESLVGARATLEAAPKAAQSAILIGPEGGFSEAERKSLRALPFVTAISLGPRILRADTAAVAALTLWQSTRGDWL